MSDVSPTRRWVATPASASSAARALVRWELRDLRFRAVIGATWLTGFIIFSLVPVADTRWARLGGAVVLGLIPTALLMLVVGCVAYYDRVRSLRRELTPGTVLTARLDADSLTLGVAQDETTVGFEALASVHPVGDWVIVRLRRSGIRLLLNRALFDEDGLTRLVAVTR